MSNYFYDKKLTLEVAYNNIEKIKHLRTDKEYVASKQDDLSKRINAYIKAIYMVEKLVD